MNSWTVAPRTSPAEMTGAARQLGVELLTAVARMQCSKCGSDNREAARFCMECGSPLSVKCPNCGNWSLPGAKFCDECSTALLDAAGASVAGAAPIGLSATGERRHLTVLFCDLVNSTNIAAELDPEEWREVVAGYHRATAKVIERFGGYVAKFLGDGVMAYFGWPQAYGDEAERAVRAGLAILEGISKLDDRVTSPKLSARVGIDSGLVVVGTGRGNEIEVFGETPNVAARLQTAAAPNTVLITTATHRLLSGLFIVEARGTHTLKDIERPIQRYQVVQPSGVRGRLEALAVSRGLTPFIGRERELRLLGDQWERATVKAN